jgi:hypothetical protein
MYYTEQFFKNLHTLGCMIIGGWILYVFYQLLVMVGIVESSSDRAYRKKREEAEIEAEMEDAETQRLGWYIFAGIMAVLVAISYIEHLLS